MMALEMTEVISVFLTPEEREELQNAVSAFNAAKKGTAKYRKAKKKIEGFEDQQMRDLKIMLDADTTGTLRGWFENLIDDEDPESDRFGSVMGTELARKALMETEWYETYGKPGKGARQWFLDKYTLEDTDLDQRYEDAANVLRDQLAQIGVDPDSLTDEEYKAFAEIYYNRAFDDPRERESLNQYVAETYMSEEGAGEFVNIGQQLREQAWANGVVHDDPWYLEQERRIEAGEANVNAYAEQFRREAASRYPIFAEQLMAGENLWTLMDPWKTAISEILEYTPKDTFDTHLQYAMEGTLGEGGQPGAMTLYDFKKYLRNQPEWESTDNGRKTIDSSLIQLANAFGVGI